MHGRVRRLHYKEASGRQGSSNRCRVLLPTKSSNSRPSEARRGLRRSSCCCKGVNRPSALPENGEKISCSVRTMSGMRVITQ